MFYNSRFVKKALRLVVFVFFLTALVTQVAASAPAQPDWSMSGQNVTNWRSQPYETKVGTNDVGTLVKKWAFTTGGDVSATPAVTGGAVYFPDWAGNLYKLNAKTGQVIWQNSLPALTGVPGTFSRSTPTLYGDYVLVGTQRGANLLAFNKDTGALLWKTQIDRQPFALLTQSPLVYKGIAYIGVSSSEEIAPLFIPGYVCCVFRGNFNAVDIATGSVLWKTYTTPDNGGQPGGYSGVAVWGSTAVYDTKRNSIYITTGNNYAVPASVSACEAQQSTTNTAPCDAANNYVDAVLALDPGSGAVKWADKLQGYDAFTIACVPFFFDPSNCPNPAGPDFDFGQGAMLIPTVSAGQSQDVLAAGQKSGVFWGIDPSTGKVLWATNAGPGGSLGGMEWGSATDGSRIYYAVSNNYGIPYKLIDGVTTTTGGLWGALDPATGKILWQTADPNGAIDAGAVSVANGVVYAGSFGFANNTAVAPAKTNPTFFALDASTGKVLWNYVSGGSVNSGAAIVNGMVYWGSGYSNLFLGQGNNQFYAFGLP